MVTAPTTQKGAYDVASMSTTMSSPPFGLLGMLQVSQKGAVEGVSSAGRAGRGGSWAFRRRRVTGGSAVADC